MKDDGVIKEINPRPSVVMHDQYLVRALNVMYPAKGRFSKGRYEMRENKSNSMTLMRYHVIVYKQKLGDMIWDALKISDDPDPHGDPFIHTREWQWMS